LKDKIEKVISIIQKNSKKEKKRKTTNKTMRIKTKIQNKLYI
jgi:hypothetical protein